MHSDDPSRNRSYVTRKHLFVLLACIFVVMVGLGITLPVLPFYVERLALAEGASREFVTLHVSFLTGVYAVGQLFFAPVWGHWSDRLGRKPLLLIGIAGYALAQVLFALATSLWLLYGARILGGILSSATLPIAAAYIADMTAEQERSVGMAWLGTATSLGFVVGPAVGGLLARKDLHFRTQYGHFVIDSFSVPFLAAAALGLLTLFVALRWLRESMPASVRPVVKTAIDRQGGGVIHSLGPLLGLVLVAQLALATFEGTFALYAQAALNYGPFRVGAAFVTCGLVMSVFQGGAIGFVAPRVSESYQIAAGFALMGTSLMLLITARTAFFVFLLIGFIALGSAFISPNLIALISKRGRDHHIGELLGVQNAANSLAQASGPILGGALFTWKANSPYLLTGAVSVAMALVIGWKIRTAGGAVNAV